MEVRRDGNEKNIGDSGTGYIDSSSYRSMVASEFLQRREKKGNGKIELNLGNSTWTAVDN